MNQKNNKYRLNLISFCETNKKDSVKGVYIIIGDIEYKNTYKNSDKLSNLNYKTKWMYNFKIKVSRQGDIKIYNEEDFKILEENNLIINYKLNNFKKENIPDKKENITLYFKKPVIYDLSKNHPVFPRINNYKINKTIFYKNYKRLFILLPYGDFILRGKLVDTCFSYVKDKSPVFIAIGGKYGNNKDNISSLYSKYLNSVGVEPEFINEISFSRINDYLDELRLTFSLIMETYNCYDYDIFIAVKGSEMNKIIKQIKENKKFTNFDNKKINYICE